MKKILFVAMSIMLISSCKKDDVEEPQVYKLGTNTYEVDAQTSQTIVKIDSTSIDLTGNTEQLQNLKVGDIIVSGITANAPYGFLRKITAIQKTGNDYKYTTEEVSLTDAFEELHIDYTKSFTVSDTSGKKEDLEFRIDIPNVVVYDEDGNSSTTYDQIKVNGSISYTPSLPIAIDVTAFRLTYAKLEGSFEIEIQTQITAGGSIASFSNEIPIYQQPLTPIQIPATPIVIVPFLRVNIGANGSINAQITASQTSTITASAFVEYKNQAWDKGGNRDIDNSFNFSGTAGSVTAKVYVEPGLDFRLYGSNWLEGSIVVQGYSEFTGTLTTCELKAGVSAGIEANAQIFMLTLATVSYPDILEYSTVLYSCPPTSGWQCGDNLVDSRDGEVYQTVEIGTQCWMKENLNYSGGVGVPQIADSVQWLNLTSPGWCYNDNNSANGTTYGKLYNWYAVNTGNLCPTGWHIPTDSEWQTLVDHVGGDLVAGGALKSTTVWKTPNTGATNSSGFTALPGSCRWYDGNFNGNIGSNGFFWTASNSWSRYLYYNESYISRYNDDKGNGFSCRCVKDR